MKEKKRKAVNTAHIIFCLGSCLPQDTVRTRMTDPRSQISASAL